MQAWTFYLSVSENTMDLVEKFAARLSHRLMSVLDWKLLQTNTVMKGDVSEWQAFNEKFLWNGPHIPGLHVFKTTGLWRWNWYLQAKSFNGSLLNFFLFFFLFCLFILLQLVLSRDVETEGTALLVLPSESWCRKYRFKENVNKDSGLITLGEA